MCLKVSVVSSKAKLPPLCLKAEKGRREGRDWTGSQTQGGNKKDSFFLIGENELSTGLYTHRFTGKGNKHEERKRNKT